MRYLDLETIKQHLNLDENFSLDDNLLESYCEAAEKAVENYLDCDLDTIIANSGEDFLPKPLQIAILLMIGDLYTVRQTISATNFVRVPQTYEMLVEPYKDYTKKTE